MKLRLAAAALLLALPAVPAYADEPQPQRSEELTVATFNASLNRDAAGKLNSDLSNGENEQARNVAETIQRADADVILVNEFDYDGTGKNADLFNQNYLQVSQNGADPVEYPYVWTGPVNTGVPSGFDLNNDESVGGPDDALGFGEFPGQYGFVVYSKYPIDTAQVRTFQNFLWKDMPDALLPTQEDGSSWYSPEELAIMPLSSKTHADIPVDVEGTTVHVLAAHPTPPSFDGPEKRNQKRNSDEIRLWRDYIADDADYLYDDQGTTGGLAPDANFVIVGDYNSDPVDGDSWPGAIDQLLDSDKVQDPKPTSAGGAEAAEKQGGANAEHKGDPALDTSDFNDDPAPGNLRVDYVLPNAAAEVSDSGIFWPTADDELSRLTGEYPFPTSDHRLVWIKATFPAPAEPAPSEPGDEGPGNEEPGDDESGDEGSTTPDPEAPGSDAPGSGDQHPAPSEPGRGLPKTGA